MNADESITAGRDALDHWWPRNYPWYDAPSDGVRRVEVRDWSWLWNWVPDWDLDFGWFWPRTALQWAAWIGILLLLALVAYLLVRAYRLRARRKASAGTGDPSSGDEGDADRIEALPFPVRAGRMDLLEEARRYYQQGDYPQAIIYLFSLQLVLLDRHHVIRLAKGKTNRQYVREVGPRRSLRQLLERTMVAFEDVFFGHHALDRARFESCWSRLEEFQSLAAEGNV